MLLIVPTGLWLPASGLSAAQIASSAVYFFLGFALFAALLVTAGMVAGDTGTQEVATVVATVAALPMVLLAVIGVEPNGLASRALSAFPVTAPGTMLVRLGLAPVPWVDHLIAIASIVVTIAVCARLAAWLVRAAVLMTGQRLSVPMLWKLMRR
jgi:ABC-2 type transport system permease protein